MRHSSLLSTLLLFFLLGTSTSYAAHLSKLEKQRISKYWDIFLEAGDKYAVEPQILLAISLHESSLRPTVINRANKNKTIDVGMMQINSWWFPTLRKFQGDLNKLYDANYNISVGAWIFKKCTKRYGVSWRAVDCYNKGESKARSSSIYVRNVQKKYALVKAYIQD